MANDGLNIGGGLMQALKLRMHYQQSRQKVLSENVANADSPGFRPVDLKPPGFDRGGVALARTSAGHMSLTGGKGGFDSTGAPRFETTPNGNAVNLEDEMMKVAQNQSDYQLAASLYSKGLGLMKIAIGKGR
ncbi:flagellar basal body rod protein FlgB [Bosea sp. SSUT16]|jgi:flagellar basal-body rod protein FlgB|uniref:Flagellar basal body rod protein FlgB n=1 Tax=Bosea spartocytisi TaxID=2773451 RepID=A0A927EFC0_9HYPH|nr:MULTISPECIES: flagellar basal body rod protein FlgB [Bosea]MBD3849532.1 flagellar basal body rod protein FlgB [Bosea spartocytisi]MCT4471531.1 flagellar basal body rod protein FlgB [Bosea spartocytisi]